MSGLTEHLTWQNTVLVVLVASQLVKYSFSIYNKILDRIQSSKGESKHDQPCRDLKDLQSNTQVAILEMTKQIGCVEKKLSNRITAVETKIDIVIESMKNGFFSDKKK